MEQQLTTAPQNHILTNTAVWSSDSQWIVYDTRSDPEGAIFDGDRIEQVNIETREVRLLYQSRNNAKCGVATHSPTENKVIFILGPEHPTPDWQYSPAHRQGVIVDTSQPNIAHNLDARNLTPPFTPGALRGGSHVHVFDPQGQLVSFTYNDALIHPDERNIGVSIPARPVTVPKSHPRNHDGDYFSVLVTQTAATPRPGSDEIRRAFEDAWVGNNGYIRQDGARQKRAIAFQGEVITAKGNPISEVFIVDLPDDLTQPGIAPLQGTATRLPAPPAGVVQRRLTFTADRPYPGISGPRHWLRSSPNGQHIAFLMKDNDGITQLWTIFPLGGEPTQLTHNPAPIASAFSWSPDGRKLAYVMNQSICITDTATGTTRLIPNGSTCNKELLPLACVFSPDGQHIAYVGRTLGFNQVFAATV
jgi:WD40 repeat protein